MMDVKNMTCTLVYVLNWKPLQLTLLVEYVLCMNNVIPTLCNV